MNLSADEADAQALAAIAAIDRPGVKDAPARASVGHPVPAADPKAALAPADRRGKADPVDATVAKADSAAARIAAMIAVDVRDSRIALNRRRRSR